MEAVKRLQEELKWAHGLLEMVMEDVTPEQAAWIPPGIANPLGATYAHAVLGEDGVVQGLLGGRAPFYADGWQGKTGASEAQMNTTFEWARSVKIDLPALRAYAQIVYAATDEYVNSLRPEDMARELDLTEEGFGHQSVSWVFTALLVAHLNNMSGEISVLKGIQGAKGYPF